MTKKTSKSNAEVFDFKSIKTFEDACKKTGIEPTEAEIKAVHAEAVRSMKAYYKLIIIFLAINNGWKPDWSDYKQWKYFPWLSVLSSGFGFGVSVCGFDISATFVGSRLCTDTKEKALYVAKQFEDLYQEYLLYSE